jgi:hypothetical protein
MKVAFLKGTGIVDMAIRLFTFSKYSHCELLFNDSVWFGNNPNGNLQTGFRRRIMIDIDKYWDFVEIKMTEDEENRIKKFCESERDCNYDWKGIFLSQIFPLNKENPDKWFCSEICTAALQVIGYLPGIKPCQISPGKLYSLIKPKI